MTAGTHRRCARKAREPGRGAGPAASLPPRACCIPTAGTRHTRACWTRGRSRACATKASCGPKACARPGAVGGLRVDSCELPTSAARRHTPSAQRGGRRAQHPAPRALRSPAPRGRCATSAGISRYSYAGKIRSLASFLRTPFELFCEHHLNQTASYGKKRPRGGGEKRKRDGAMGTGARISRRRSAALRAVCSGPCVGVHAARRPFPSWVVGGAPPRCG